MVIKREVAYGIVQGLSEFLNSEELQDFTVTVGETKFGCHKLLLASCSGFFRGLFRSGMKETKQNCATLEEISSETFQLILETIYTGRGILTADNIIDVWRAAHQLQITFMITECEMFVITSLSLENYIQYFHYGSIFSSEIVTKTVWNFFLLNFNSFLKTSYFLDLPFNDLLNLIKSQDLVTSTEDDVLQAIINWVEYTPEKKLQSNANTLNVIDTNILTTSPNVIIIKLSDTNKEEISDGNSTRFLKDNTTFNNNQMSCNKSVSFEESGTSSNMGLCDSTLTDSDNRKQHLFELILNARTCLASHECLEMLLSHPLVSETKQVRDIINKAIMYQLQICKRNGHWPTGATHRNNSQFENVAITFKKDSKVMVYSFSQHNWNEFKIKAPFDNQMIIQMVTIDKSLYILCVQYDFDATDDDYYDCPCLVYLLTDSKKWSPINISFEIINDLFSVVSVDDCIYIVQKDKLWKLNPTLQSVVSLCDLPDKEPICHLTSYDKTILAFYSVSNEVGVHETSVISFDISKNLWTQLNNIDGPDYGMTSFKDDHSFYLLKPFGDLWKLVKPQHGVIDFVLVAKLWKCFWPLHGAVVFLDELYLYGTLSDKISNDPLRPKSVSGLFKKINYMQSPEPWIIKAMFVPFILDKKLLVSI